MRKLLIIIPAIIAFTATRLMAGEAGPAGAGVVPVCHKVQQSSSVNKPVFTLWVPESAVQAHLDHGDRRGEFKDGVCRKEVPGEAPGEQGEPIG